MQLSCTSCTCVFLCVYDKVGVLLILLIFSFHVTSYWCLSAIIKDTKECTVINDCSLMTFSCNSEGGMGGVVYCTNWAIRLLCCFIPAIISASQWLLCLCWIVRGSLPATVKTIMYATDKGLQAKISCNQVVIATATYLLKTNSPLS